MMIVPVTLEPRFSAGTATVLFETDVGLDPDVGGGAGIQDIAPDGRRFLALMEQASPDENTSRPRINIVLNWTEELKRLVPVD